MVGRRAAFARPVAEGDPPQTLLASMRDRERQATVVRAGLAALDAGPAVRAAAPEIRREAMRERFVFYPKAKGRERWYDLGVTPTLDRFFGAIPQLKVSFLRDR